MESRDVQRSAMDVETSHRRILIVDDEPNIRDVLRQYLEAAGYSVSDAADGHEALDKIAASPPDLVVLDLMLPGIDGIEVCHRVRQSSATPILMLTARGDEPEKVEGFRAGADDYVTKPFSPREVIMRVQAILRRLDATGVPAMVLDDAVYSGSLVMRLRLRTAERDGVPLDLTAKEFDLLQFFASRPRQVFTRQQLLDHVWDIGFYGDASTVTVHIRRLREKLEIDPARPQHIKTVWGVGYKFEP